MAQASSCPSALLSQAGKLHVFTPSECRQPLAWRLLFGFKAHRARRPRNVQMGEDSGRGQLRGGAGAEDEAPVERLGQQQLPPRWVRIRSCLAAGQATRSLPLVTPLFTSFDHGGRGPLPIPAPQALPWVEPK